MIKKITTPIDYKVIKSLSVGDKILLSGQIITARDAAHKLMVEQHPEFLKPLLKESVIYHCGPIVAKNDDEKWRFISAGPTTSSREEPYEADVINYYNVRGIIGKGGMGKKTMEALQKNDAVYFHAIGGAGAFCAKCVKEVKTVHMLKEFGSPEAFWVIKVVDFPLIVTMDSNGMSLHQQVEEEAIKKANIIWPQAKF